MFELLEMTEWRKKVMSDPKKHDLIEDLLADTNELSIVTGRSEIGKTNLCLNMAYSLATGAPFLKFKIVKPVSVAYIGFEGDPKQFLERIKKIEKNYPSVKDRLFLKPDTQIFKLTKTSLADFKQAVQGCRVIIIDPIKYIVPGDYLSPKDITSFLATFQGVLAQVGALAIGVIHFRKQNQNYLMDTDDLWNIKGGTEWGDTASTVLLMERTRQQSFGRGGFQPINKDNVTLYFAKTRNAVNAHPPVNLSFNRQKVGFDIV